MFENRLKIKIGVTYYKIKIKKLGITFYK